MSQPGLGTKKTRKNKLSAYFSGLKQNTGRNRLVAAVLFIIIFAGIGSYVYIVSRAAGVASLSMSAAASIGEGETLILTINEDSQSVKVNSVEADFSYDTNKLTFVGINTANGAFSTVDGPRGESNGRVYIIAGSSTERTGAQQVAQVTFRAKSGAASNLGAAAFIFDDTSAVMHYDATSNVSTNELSTKTGTTANVTDKTAPSTPTSITKVSNNPTTLTIRWSASTDNSGAIASYIIYRGSGATGAQTQVGTTTGSTVSFTDTGLAINNTYNYSVQAKDAAGNVSAKSSVTPLTLTDSGKPTVPSNLNVQSKTSQSVTLGWNASTDDVGVVGYKIYRAGGSTATNTTSGLSYTDSGLNPNTAYTYQVAAYDAAGNTSDASATVNVTTSELTGDINGGGCVGAIDLSILLANFGKSGMSKAQGNITEGPNENGAQVVNIYDFSVLIANLNPDSCTGTKT